MYMYVCKWVHNIPVRIHVSTLHLTHIALPKASTPQEPVVEVVDTASQSIITHLICPICQRSVVHSSIHNHFTECLQEVII